MLWPCWTVKAGTCPHGVEVLVDLVRIVPAGDQHHVVGLRLKPPANRHDRRASGEQIPIDDVLGIGPEGPAAHHRGESDRVAQSIGGHGLQGLNQRDRSAGLWRQPLLVAPAGGVGARRPDVEKDVQVAGVEIVGAVRASEEVERGRIPRKHAAGLLMDRGGERGQQAATLCDGQPGPGVDRTHPEERPPPVDLRDVHEAAVGDEVDVAIERHGLRGRRRRDARNEQRRRQHLRTGAREDVVLDSTHLGALRCNRRAGGGFG